MIVQWLFDVAISGSALIIKLALFAIPFGIGALIYRPYEKHLIWLQKISREQNLSHEDSLLFDRARHRYETGPELKRGCALAVLGTALGFAWVGFVLANWHRVGRALFD